MSEACWKTKHTERCEVAGSPVAISGSTLHGGSPAAGFRNPDRYRHSCSSPNGSMNCAPAELGFCVFENSVRPTCSPVAGSIGLCRYFTPTIPGAFVKNGGKNSDGG